MTPQILKAFEHIRHFHPEVCIVIFSKEERWQYMDEDFNAPLFSQQIDVSILEDAEASVPKLPAIYQL